MKNDFFKHILLSGGSKQNRAEIENAELPVTFSGNGHRLRNYRIYGNSVERKNLLKNTAVSQTINGVTFAVNEDGSVTANGTAQSLIYFVVGKFYLSQGNYFFGGCPDGGSFETFSSSIRITSGNIYLPEDNNKNAIDSNDVSLIVSDSAGKELNYSIRIAQGYTCSNLTFYPMIRKADIDDSTYEPYIENTSVGDLQANGKYLVPVTVSGNNLFDENYLINV